MAKVFPKKINPINLEFLNHSRGSIEFHNPKIFPEVHEFSSDINKQPEITALYNKKSRVTAVSSKVQFLFLHKKFTKIIPVFFLLSAD